MFVLYYYKFNLCLFSLSIFLLRTLLITTELITKGNIATENDPSITKTEFHNKDGLTLHNKDGRK
jgi:hypothetical protein